MSIAIPKTPVGQDGLTSRQRAIYQCLANAKSLRLPQPSVREMMSIFGVKSPNGICTHLRALEKKGWISRAGMKTRSIKIHGKDQVQAKELILKRLAAHFPNGVLNTLSSVSVEVLTMLAAELDSPDQ